MHFGEDIFQAGQFLLGGIQLVERGFAAGLVFFDPGRFLEEPAAFLGVVAEDLLHHLQLDHRIGIRAHAGIGEEVDDVHQAHRFVVDQVFTLPGAVQAAGDLQFGIFGRQHVAVVLDKHGDFRQTEGLAGGGAVENQVVHPVAAQNRGALLPQHPADRVDDVAFAAAVGTDHSGQPLIEFEHGFMGKGFEPEDF